MRSLTPVGQASFASGCFVTKQGHNVRVTSQHQFICILEVGLQSASAVIHKGAVREPTIRAYLLTRLPHSLLFGRLRGDSELTLQRPSPSSRRHATTPERAEEEDDGELEALVRCPLARKTVAVKVSHW
ncbi:uncharacterized protein ACA1_395390 [Acanthamoeba castellanii str. Neff]|uniref:Uncharacterized protein n=1 Tax=Acanthamoeba castellanii (strain ATCC 30010 / Neff) TaxID=1257118 RepID=L8H0H2_ACACF|nr:uncharacterized protein ACA1_395390 [Acanthamoeba castellanii str. Neff]ELR18712.1 hypothetical protein ACA1_395390 [Acanthamoeba castellanii str. Neff]